MKKIQTVVAIERLSIDNHFVNRPPSVRQIYDRILSKARSFGPVVEDPKKTSIHLAKRSAFAGIQTRRNSLILTLKSTENIEDSRIFRRQRASANRWYLEARLASADDVDDWLTEKLRLSYELSG